MNIHEPADVSQTNSKPSNNEDRAISQISMTAYEKQRFTEQAKKHGLSLSAFFRMAANDYIQRNNWE